MLNKDGILLVLEDFLDDYTTKQKFQVHITDAYIYVKPSENGIFKADTMKKVKSRLDNLSISTNLKMIIDPNNVFNIRIHTKGLYLHKNQQNINNFR